MTSEVPGADYESEFAAPVHSVLQVHQEGLRRITTVIMDGEIVEFEWPQAKNLGNRQEGINE